MDENQTEPGSTSVTITNGEETTKGRYQLFVECGGQKPLGLDNYPFRSLVEQGIVCDATALFADDAAAEVAPPDKVSGKGGRKVFLTGGIGIDSAYRVLRRYGAPEPSIYDLAFPHTSGTRPYSYGLQACSTTSRIMVSAWVQAIVDAAPVDGGLGNVTELYEAT